MLIWITALHCEAKPVIDFYGLKKSPQDAAFETYRGDNMACVVSGIGKIASAAATAWSAANFAGATNPVWINLGIAGAGEHDIGMAFLLNQIRDADSGQRYYPAPGADTVFPGSPCLTLSQPSTDYLDNCLFDQEASGFIYTALRFSSAELTQSIKIISDNRQQQAVKDRAQTSALINAQMSSIDRQANNLLELAQANSSLAIASDSWQRLISLAHFTQTQQSRLRILWRYLSATSASDQALFAELANRTDATQILQILEQLSIQRSANL